MMFNKILIANRGEIAMRVIRACRELAIPTVAVYTEPDATGIYVKKADEAHYIGSEPVQGYLDMDRIVQLANKTGADAIHPGYGFLSENAEFAWLCRHHGITFIGPSPETIYLMGNKIQARQAVAHVGIPVIPGTDDAISSEQDALTFARTVGYPIMIKASAGGGGRGLRIVKTDDELRMGLESASREAEAAFGTADVFLEQYIERAHHIEFQILADRDGNCIHLGERDCSIQRRHQKLIEISPSLVLNSTLRETMGQAAVTAAKAVEYDNVGTIEFLLDTNQKFYFMEMNTRIQVEHTVTEEITGMDLVRAQIECAAGFPLSTRQEHVVFNGHSIQCRINAEDPKKDFLPCAGTVTAYYSPGGIGVRIDGVVYKDYVVPLSFDTLLAKLIVTGRSWPETVSRMRRSLEEFVLRGVKTSIPFLQRVIEDPDFLAGHFDTTYIETHPHLFEYSSHVSPEEVVTAVSAAIAAYEGL